MFSVYWQPDWCLDAIRSLVCFASGGWTMQIVYKSQSKEKLAVMLRIRENYWWFSDVTRSPGKANLALFSNIKTNNYLELFVYFYHCSMVSLYGRIFKHVFQTRFHKIKVLVNDIYYSFLHLAFKKNQLALKKSFQTYEKHTMIFYD